MITYLGLTLNILNISDWIAERLGMGSRGYLNHLLFRHRKSGRQ